MASGRQAIVVSFAGESGLLPRGERTKTLARALEEAGYTVERVPGVAARPVERLSLAGRALRKALSTFVTDYMEPHGAWVLSRWRPRGVGALLIGWPFGPLPHAAKRLHRARIPYVVDLGDPWLLTSRQEPKPWPVRQRTLAAESFLWGYAAGGIVTTATQADRLRELFPDLPLLARPNGYRDFAAGAARPRAGEGGRDDEIRLVHFGSMYAARLPVAEWFSRLRREGGLRRVQVTNYGFDDAASLQIEDPNVSVEVRPPVSWDEACRVAAEFDGAIVVGNRDPALLPSKAVQYLTLPIPRIALTQSRDGDELTRFAAARPGFMAVDVNSGADLARAVAHLRRPWPAAELEPPASDSWREVSREIVGFVTACWNRGSDTRDA